MRMINRPRETKSYPQSDMHITYILRQWGKSKSIGWAPNGYPPMVPFANQIRNPGAANVSMPHLPDDLHLRVDREISDLLRKRKDDHYFVICLAYMEGKKDGQIAKELNRSRSWARTTRIAAEHYLEARLE